MTRRLCLLLFVAAAAAFILLPSTAMATHGFDRDCSSFANQTAAQNHLLAHPGDPDGLDADRDGRACESLPCPCGATGAPPLPPPAPVPPPPPAPVPPPPLAPEAPSEPLLDSQPARVLRVTDGDTLKVRLSGGRTVDVRLIGIDTPETRKPGTAVECGGPEATARMKKLAFSNGVGRVVKLRSDPTQDRVDRYGRVLAYVGGGGVDFGHTMILSGWAKTYVYERDFQRVAKYRTAQRSARSAKRGVWRKCGGNFHRRR